MIETGRPVPLGATFDHDGVNFAIWSGAAERIELCLFDQNGHESRRYELPGQTDGTWHGYLPGCDAGQRYGYRAYGSYDPEAGLRFNPNKLLIDPYARAIAGEFSWSPNVFDFMHNGDEMLMNTSDSAPFIPKCVVCTNLAGRSRKPAVPWSETIIYEANVRGYTMRHPAVSATERGKFRGMQNAEILAYLKSLGITTIELMPVHEFIDEEALVKRGQRNYWGYNSINYFTPASRYSISSPRQEFREMTDAIHDAGFEVLIDVVYNHTGETDRFGPTLSFRGIDNLSYYRTVPGDPGQYINDTGCGNTVNADHPRVRELILDSLRYWATEMGVDGYRFDLATVTARTANGFSDEHPLLQAIASDKVLNGLKFIAEPWDLGPGGYQLGKFPAQWSEWNDQYRNSVRRFWRGDHGEASEFASRLHGSSDIFEHSGRRPAASINFISAHDGFTLADVVSYEQRHNAANGEGNRDGHAHNFSCNYGIEGRTDSAEVLALRRKQRLNMLATLLLSQGTPMLLGGDEFGNSQLGNNNAYAQDNETGWIDWSGLHADPEFQAQVEALVNLRQSVPLIRQNRYVHDADEIEWWHPDGREMQAEDWSTNAAFAWVRYATSDMPKDGTASIAVLVNSLGENLEFVLPDTARGAEWELVWSDNQHTNRLSGSKYTLAGPGLAVLSANTGVRPGQQK